jgi:hypothetical protein
VAETAEGKRVLADSLIAGIGLSAPVWLQELEQWLHWMLLIGGVLLLALRVANALLELWARYRDRSRECGTQSGQMLWSRWRALRSRWRRLRDRKRRAGDGSPVQSDGVPGITHPPDDGAFR